MMAGVHQKHRDAIVDDLDASLERLAENVLFIDSLSAFVAFLAEGAAELDTLIGDLRDITQLSEDETKRLRGASARLKGHMISWIGDMALGDFNINDTTIPTSKQFSVLAELTPDERISLIHKVRMAFDVTVSLALVDCTSAGTSAHAAFLMDYSSLCMWAPELFFLVVPGTRAEILALEPEGPNVFDLHDNQPNGYVVTRYFIESALRAHQQRVQILIAKGLFNSDSAALRAAIEMIEDLLYFLHDTIIRDRWVGDFNSLDAPTNLVTLMYTALLRKDVHVIVGSGTGILVVSSTDKIVIAIDYPAHDFNSWPLSGWRDHEYRENPLIFTLLYSHERRDGHRKNWEGLAAHLEATATEIDSGEMLSAAMRAPISRATLVGVFTWLVSYTTGSPDATGAIVAATVDFIVESVVSTSRDRRQDPSSA